jgi:hypothetical protein
MSLGHDAVTAGVGYTSIRLCPLARSCLFASLRLYIPILLHSNTPEFSSFSYQLHADERNRRRFLLKSWTMAQTIYVVTTMRVACVVTRILIRSSSVVLDDVRSSSSSNVGCSACRSESNRSVAASASDEELSSILCARSWCQWWSIVGTRRINRVVVNV